VWGIKKRGVGGERGERGGGGGGKKGWGGGGGGGGRERDPAAFSYRHSQSSASTVYGRTGTVLKNYRDIPKLSTLN